MKKKKKNNKRKNAKRFDYNQLSSTKIWTFRFILIILPVFFLIILESFLRLIDYGLKSDLLQPSTVDPRYLEINPELGRRYFTNVNVTPSVSHDVITAVKSENTFRIFVLGGSSAAGYPYSYNGSFSSMLRIMLENTYPEINFEMMNLAMTAVNSYTMRDISKRLWKYKPDLILIYSGHNEFYGALGVGSVEFVATSRTIVNIYLSLTHWKTFQLIQGIINWVSRSIRSLTGNGEESEGTVMERIVRKKEISFGDPLYRDALKIYEENLTDILQKANKQNVPVILSTLVSNVYHQKPFVDKHSSIINQEEWSNFYNQAKAAFEADNLDKATDFIQKCISLDSLTATPYYILGKIKELKGDTSNIKKYFYKAKDYDALRFRASEDFNKVITFIGEQFNVTVADVKLEFERQSKNKIPGNNLFLEHLHPNLKGYLLMAKTFYQSIIDSNYLPYEPQRLQSDSILMKDLGLTEFDKEIGNIRIQILTSGWPFNNNKVGSLRNIKYNAKNLLQKLVIKFWEKEITWEKAHVLLAEHYIKSKQYNLAEQEYRALVVGTPFNPSPYHRLGFLLVSQERFEEALPILHKLISLEKNLFAYKMLGAIYINRNEVKRGIPYLETAYNINSEDAQNLYNLSGAYMLNGELQKARRTAERLKQINPGFPGLDQLMVNLEKLSNSRNKE